MIGVRSISWLFRDTPSLLVPSGRLEFRSRFARSGASAPLPSIPRCTVGLRSGPGNIGDFIWNLALEAAAVSARAPRGCAGRRRPPSRALRSPADRVSSARAGRDGQPRRRHPPGSWSSMRISSGWSRLHARELLLADALCTGLLQRGALEREVLIIWRRREHSRRARAGPARKREEPSGAPEPPRPGSSWPSRTTQRRCSGPGAAGCDGEEGGVTQADGRRSPPRRSRALRRYTGLRPRSGAGRRTNDAPFARSAADRLWRRWRRYRRMLVTVGVRRQRLEVFG